MNTARWMTALMVIALATFAAPGARAQAYPSLPIRLISPAPPGALPLGPSGRTPLQRYDHALEQRFLCIIDERYPS